MSDHARGIGAHLRAARAEELLGPLLTLRVKEMPGDEGLPDDLAEAEDRRAPEQDPETFFLHLPGQPGHIGELALVGGVVPRLLVEMVTHEPAVVDDDRPEPPVFQQRRHAEDVGGVDVPLDPVPGAPDRVPGSRGSPGDPDLVKAVVLAGEGAHRVEKVARRPRQVDAVPPLGGLEGRALQLHRGVLVITALADVRGADVIHETDAEAVAVVAVEQGDEGEGPGGEGALLHAPGQADEVALADRLVERRHENPVQVDGRHPGRDGAIHHLEGGSVPAAQRPAQQPAVGIGGCDLGLPLVQAAGRLPRGDRVEPLHGGIRFDGNGQRQTGEVEGVRHHAPLSRGPKLPTRRRAGVIDAFPARKPRKGCPTAGAVLSPRPARRPGCCPRGERSPRNGPISDRVSPGFPRRDRACPPPREAGHPPVPGPLREP